MNKIDITKQYKTRSGLPVRIYVVDVEHENYTVHGAYLNKYGWNIESWRDNGDCYDDTNQEELDLIEVGNYDHINIDDRVICWNNKDGIKHKRHFAKIDEFGNPLTYKNGATSFTCDKFAPCTMFAFDMWENCELYKDE